MAIYYREVDNNIIISGKTYPYKDLIKSFGGIFQKVNRVWTIPSHPDSLTRVHELCKSVGGGPLKSSSKPDTTPKPSLEDTTRSQVNDNTPQALGLSISELMQQVSLGIQSAFPRAIWILGEIQSLNQRASGYFFQIADTKENSSKSATITANVTLWTSNLAVIQRRVKSDLEELLQEGLRVRLLVQVGFYMDRGSLSLNVLDLDPNFTKGALALAREELLKKLRSQGLDRKNKSLADPVFPFRIGLLSADKSRAKSDFIDQLKSYGFPGTVIFHPVQMQGENTVTGIVQGIEALCAKGCDYIVITRGGGSHADLRWFDHQDIALAIAHGAVPIIAAIGHHDDICVAEEIAYRREKTPTAAADFIISSFSAARDRIEKARNLLSQLMERRWNVEQEKAKILAERLATGSKQQISLFRERKRHLSAGLQKAGSGQLHQGSQNLMEQGHRLKETSQTWLSLEFKKTWLLENQFQQKSQQKLKEQDTHLQSLKYRLKFETAAELSRTLDQIQKTELSLTSSDPSPWLAKGWTQLMQNGTRISHASQIDPEIILHAQLLDAQIGLKLTDINGEKINHE